MLELLLARAGRFADEAAEHRYLNQLRTAGDAYDHIASLQCVCARGACPGGQSVRGEGACRDLWYANCQPGSGALDKQHQGMPLHPAPCPAPTGMCLRCDTSRPRRRPAALPQ